MTRSIHQGASLRRINLVPSKGTARLFPCWGGKGYEEDEGEEGDEGEEEDDEEGRGDNDEEDKSDEGSEEDNDELVGWVDNSGTRPFILSSIWRVNDSYLTMSRKVFNTLHDLHQIPDNIPVHLPEKFEKCYSGKTANMGMYDTLFTTGLSLPLMELHRQLANYLDLSIN